MPDPAETRRAAPERIELANGYYWRRGKDHVGDIYYVLLDRHGNRTLAYDAAIRERAAADGETVDWRARAERLAEALAAVREKRAPVQGFQAGIPWSLHLRAYDAYCKRYGRQQALIEGGCRGGFDTDELDMFVPGWRAEVSEIARLKKELAEARTTAPAGVVVPAAKLAELRALSERATAGPWKPGPFATDIWAPFEKGGDTKLFDVRGWGYFTGKGHGALGLTENQAREIMSANAHLVTQAVNLFRDLLVQIGEPR